MEVDSRLGWLLLMSRLNHPDERFVDGNFFTTSLAGVGLRVDRSVVSRWESGYVPARHGVLAAYEKVLGLPTGRLSATAAALRRTYDDAPAKLLSAGLDPGADQFHDRLDALLDVVTTDHATGADWATFGEHVSATPMLYLHTDTWRQVSARLVDQLGRSVGLAASQRFEAAYVLLEHRIAKKWVVAAVCDWLADRSAPNNEWLVRLLEGTDDPAAAEVLLDRLIDLNGMAFDTTVSVIAHKAGLGHFNSQQLDRIERLLLQAICRPGADPAGVAELVEALPESARRRLRKAAAEKLHTPIPHAGRPLGEMVGRELAGRLSESLARDLRNRMPRASLYDNDLMTRRLIRDALFSARHCHRHSAAVMLQASPFGDELAEVLANEIHHHGLQDATTAHLARLLAYVITEQQREQVATWLTKAPIPTAYYLAHAMGSLPVPVAQAGELLDALANDGSRLDGALIRVLGMSRDVAALEALASDPNASAGNQQVALWWLQHGGAVLD